MAPELAATTLLPASYAVNVSIVLYVKLPPTLRIGAAMKKSLPRCHR